MSENAKTVDSNVVLTFFDKNMLYGLKQFVQYGKLKKMNVSFLPYDHAESAWKV